MSLEFYRINRRSTTLRRAKSIRLPVPSSRQLPNISRPRPLYAGALFPRSGSISSEAEDTQADENDVIVSTRRPLNRGPLIKQVRSEKSASRSEYALSVGRRPSPVRSIVSLPDRRSRSPGKPASVTETAVEGDRLWDAIRKAGQGRRRHYL